MAIRNRNFGISLSILLLTAVVSGCSAPGSRQEPSRLRTAEESEYRRLLAEAQQLSFTLDFNQLRRAFVASAEYNPHGGVKLAGLPEAYGAVESAEFGDCLEYVDRVLDSNYMSLEAHMIGVVCSGQAGDFEREDRHRYMVEGLMSSIESSGDGRTQDSAYQTISTSELRGFVRLKGLQVLDQDIVYDREGIYDKMRVRDPESGEEYPLFFDVSRQFAREMDNRKE
ncbi:DUF4919 domain-containing protein [Microbulbifer rhizosphaerae]|uniref:DUF4919 domain-containing protein n=1 Tax=Microbulbifer rhizosphaerae TaxID=1562603 RepID=A0A7W4WAN5_9GAMM|nr:DUF4919 domain-containing protein [Microbulbifer rhizosphaerae]MBB3060739.1 hypothetical protein [Microbulbifer rhizosphaerae]